MKTLATISEGIFKEKGSKFIAYALPVKNEEEIKAHLSKLKKEHHSARHHCYAYRLGETGQLWRANDDGEPSGTGGKPILGQLQSYELSNALIIVVRYFGGVLLGKGGLIHAYRNAAADAIQNNKLIPLDIKVGLEIEAEESDFHSVFKTIKQLEGEIIHQSYADNYKIVVSISKKNLNTLQTLYEKKIRIINL